MEPELLSLLPPELRARVAQRLDGLALENKLLREELRLLRLEKYGAKSEQLTDAQIQLLEMEPGVTASEVESEAARSQPEKQAVEKQRRKEHPGRHELPPHLPRRENIIRCPPEQCRCTQCGGEKQVIGYDSSEELDVEPAVYFVKVNKREKRACKRCEEAGVSMAPIEPKIVEKSKASNRVIIDVILDKYANHLPLYRQCAIFEREAGLELSRGTLCGWVMKAGDLLEAICRTLRKDLMEGGYIQADETPVGVQSKRTKGKNHQAYLWEYSRPGGPVIFDFQMGRSREGPRVFLGNFAGVLQSDGYAAYDRIGGQGITYAGCWAHARRGFVEALKVNPGEPEAKAILAEIGQLYAVEKTARESRATPPERASLRAERSVPVLQELKTKIVAVRQTVLGQSALGKACDYALGQWPRLMVFATHGQVEIDNNWCENAMRPVALGRKNWLHIGSQEAGPRIAAIASILETCRRLGINVRDYLMDVLPRLADWPAKRLGELTPAAWAAQRAS